MTDRRPGPPLFELMSKDQPDPHDSNDSHKSHDGQGSSSDHAEAEQLDSRVDGGGAGVGGGVSVGRCEEVDQGEAANAPRDISAGVSRAERSAVSAPEQVPQNEGVVQLTMSRVYLLIAIVFASWVLVWVVAYKLGDRDGRNDMERLIDTPSVVLPPVGLGLVGEPVDQAGTGGGDEGISEPPRVPAASVQAVMSAQGYVNVDPRVSGSNYLQLATLSTEQAADAVMYMNDHGIAIIGVPVVDSGVRAGNNPSRYTLYSLGLAVPGGAQFGAMESQRVEHKRMIARLGAQWQRERRGGSDFGESKTQWVKYN